MRKIILYAAGLLFLNMNVYSQASKSICKNINELNNKILHGYISRNLAKDQFKSLIIALNKNLDHRSTDKSWMFPLHGYQASAIGGIRGNGYSDKGYNYLDGNKHAAHPAHDIFIRDSNQDNMDDKTHQPVNVLAIADGMVIACCNEWDNKSTLRGGRYIWIYHPQLNILSYYAHNQMIFVTPGDMVKQGQKIAEVGRTGFNAFKRRSPTHLHFGTYRLPENLPVPFNCYTELTKAQTK